MPGISTRGWIGSGATTPTYDANGNMTKAETGKLFVYDAWNRLVAVKNSGGTVLKSYGYDALNHRVSETVSGTTTDLYYSAGWQVLEERVGGVTRASNVWSHVYVDAMISRDRDTDANGTLDERLYAVHDANFNVTGLVNTSGAVVERYVYDSYGAVTVLNASWTVLGSSTYAWQYLHQGGRADGVSGLVHFRNRDYSPTLGRWVTMDPIRYAAGDVDLYRAVGNNPSKGLDPSGLVDWEYDRKNGIITMKIYVNFAFTDAGADKWTKKRKKAFIDCFVDRVQRVWNFPEGGKDVVFSATDEAIIAGGNSKVLTPTRTMDNFKPFGPTIANSWTPVLQICESTYCSDFVMTVEANATNTFIVSSANIGGPYASLDEADITPINKGANSKQLPAAHEFGHLLGLKHPGIDLLRPDRTDYGKDYNSLMGGGAEMRAEYYQKWKTRLKEKFGVDFNLVIK